MSFYTWQTQSIAYRNAINNVGSRHSEWLSHLCKLAYEAGERSGREQAEVLAKRSIELNNIMRDSKEEQT